MQGQEEWRQIPAEVTTHYYETHCRAQAKCRHRSGAFTPFAREEIEQSIAARFAKIVAQYPDRLAVQFGSRSMTYAELNQASNCVAHRLLDLRGSDPEPIAMLFDHGADMIIALLGVLKAGKYYAPLNPHDPVARSRIFIETAGADVVLTDSQNAPAARDMIDDEGSVIETGSLACERSLPDPDIVILPDHYAFLLFTSGSTGEPKGVAMNQYNTLHATMSYANSCGMCVDDRTAFVNYLSFSGHVQPLYTALLVGGAIFPFDVRREGVHRLATWLAEEEITVIIGGAIFRQLTQTLASNDLFPHLRLFYHGGGPVYRSDVELYRRHFSDDCIFVNSFAMTETRAIYRFFMDKKIELEHEMAPVGYAAMDMEALLWDGDGQPVPAGEAGEIVVRSSHMAAGYWRREDLTKTRFLPDPARPDGRLFKTGDLGKMLPDGCLLHFGRVDHQVKIRGHRVEVLEVEGLLGRQPGVKEAVVHPFESRHGDRTLVGYVVAEPDAPALSADVLRSAVARELPGYMVPVSYIFLDELPRLATSGKVDRNALPEPERVRPELATPYAPPATPLEARLADIWAEVLDLDRVGVEDRFTDLGGHSLAAVRLLAALDELTERELPYAVLVEAATVRELAHLLEADNWAPRWSSLVQVQAGDERIPLFLVPAAASTSIGFAKLTAEFGSRQSVYGFDPLGLNGRSAPQESVEEMAAHYIYEMRRLQPAGPYLLGGRCFGAHVALEMAVQLEEAGESVPLLAVLDAAPPKSGPTWTVGDRLLWHPENRWANLRARLKEKGAGRVLSHAVRRRYARTQRRRHRHEMSEETLAAHGAAQTRYRGRVYAGRMVVYLSEALADAETRRRWTELAVSGCEIVLLPESVHSESLRTDASVQAIARHLRGEICALAD